MPGEAVGLNLLERSIGMIGEVTGRDLLQSAVRVVHAGTALDADRVAAGSEESVPVVASKRRRHTGFDIDEPACRGRADDLRDLGLEQAVATGRLRDTCGAVADGRRALAGRADDRLDALERVGRGVSVRTREIPTRSRSSPW